MPPAWQRELTGILGVEQDVKSLYAFVDRQVANLKTWILNELAEVRNLVANYEQAANDAIAALNGLTSKVVDLSSQLQVAIASNDTAAIQSVADQLEQHAQAANAVINPTTPATPDAPVPSAPADPTPVAPADSTSVPVSDAPSPVDGSGTETAPVATTPAVTPDTAPADTAVPADQTDPTTPAGS